MTVGMLIGEEEREEEAVPQQRVISGHAKRLREYNKFRQAQEYQEVLNKIGFHSEDYAAHPFFPGTEVWRFLGKQYCGKTQGPVVLPVKIWVPPTLVMWPASKNICFYTDRSTGKLCRVEGVSIKFFRSLLTESNMPVADPEKTPLPETLAKTYDVLDPPSDKRLSSSYSKGCKSARLMGSGWMPAKDDDEPWHSMPCKTTTSIRGVLLRGHPRDTWVTGFKISHSLDGLCWFEIEEGRIFPGNRDTNKLVEVFFKHAVVTRWLRLHPVMYSGALPGLRVAMLVDKNQKKLEASVLEPAVVVKCPFPGDNVTATHALLPSQMPSVLMNSVIEPQVVQKYIRARGNTMSIYRCVWRAFTDSYAYQITNKHSTTDSVDCDVKFLVTQESVQKLAVFLLKPAACSEICARTADIAGLLTPQLRTHGEIETLVTDWVRSPHNKYYFLQVKGWSLRKVFRVPVKPKRVDSSLGSKCAMCGKRTQLECKMTAAMIYNTIKLKKSKSEWPLNSHVAPKGTGSVRYASYRVCKECYEIHQQELRAYRMEKQLAASMKMTTDDLTDTSLATKQRRNPAGTVYYEPKAACFTDFIKEVSTGIANTTERQDTLHKWSFILYFDHLYNLPTQLITGDMHLTVKELLHKKDRIGVFDGPPPFVSESQVGHHRLHALSVRIFYCTSGEAVRAFFSNLKMIEVGLSMNKTLLGVVQFPLAQLLSSSGIQRISMLRMFGSSALKNCSLRLQVGLTSTPVGHIYNRKDLVLDKESGFYFQEDPVTRISALPEDWKKLVLDGMVETCSAVALKETVEEYEKKTPSPDENSLMISGEMACEMSGANTAKGEEGYEIPQLSKVGDGYGIATLAVLKKEMSTAKEILNHLAQQGVGKKKAKASFVPTRRVKKLKRSVKHTPPPSPPEEEVFMGQTVSSGTSYNTSTSLAERLQRIQHPRHKAGSRAVSNAWVVDEPKKVEQNIIDNTTETLEASSVMQITTEEPTPVHTLWQLSIAVTCVDGEVGDDHDTTWNARYSLFGKEVSYMGFRLMKDGPVMFEEEEVCNMMCPSMKALGTCMQSVNDTGELVVMFHNAFHGSTVYSAVIPLEDLYEPLLVRKSPHKIDGWFPLKRHTLLSPAEDLESVSSLSLPSPSPSPRSRVSFHAEPEPLIEITITLRPHDTVAKDVTIIKDLRPEHDVTICAHE